MEFNLQLNHILLIVCDLELIKLQINYGGVKVMVFGMLVCDWRWIGGESEDVC